MVRKERIKGRRRWRWNTNTWHYDNWADYARKNWFWVAWNVFFGCVMMGFGVADLMQLSWWAVYFISLAIFNIANVTYFPLRSMARHRVDDALWISRFMSHGMPIETATMINNLICEGQAPEAGKVVMRWGDQLHRRGGGL